MMLLSQTFVQQRHGTPYVDPLSRRIAMSEQAALDWVKTYRRLVDEHVCTPLPFRASLGGAEKPTEQQPDWVVGRWAGNYTWDSLIGLRASTLKPTEQLVLGDFPTLPNAQDSGLFGRPTVMYAVGRSSEQTELAARLMNFLLCDPEAAEVLGRTRGLPSAKSALAVLKAQGGLPPLELAAHEQIRAQREAGRLRRPAPLFEHARFLKFMRRGLRDRRLRQDYGHRRGAPPGPGRQRPAAETLMKATERQLHFATKADPDTGARVTRSRPWTSPATAPTSTKVLHQRRQEAGLRRRVRGGQDFNYHLLDLESQVATQLSDQPGENSFGGFLSPDDQFLYFVRQERRLIRLALRDLSEEVVYTVPEGWVGYGTWVANSACTKMVGIEIHADDWFPLSDWKKFHDMFHAKPRCRLIRIGLATGAARSSSNSRAGSATRSTGPSTTTPSPTATRARTTSSTRACGSSTRTARTVAAPRSMPTARAAPTSSGCPMARRWSMCLT